MCPAEICALHGRWIPLDHLKTEETTFHKALLSIVSEQTQTQMMGMVTVDCSAQMLYHDSCSIIEV